MEHWWQNGAVYQIYPRSFQDSDGDGMGDLRGILSRLDILKELGVSILWLSPVYPSPGADNGYDISDYRNIDPRFGTMADMETLIHEANSRNMRVIMDLVINHTSTAHEWFEKSRRRIEPYTNYYYWRPKGPKGGKPNNWTGFFGEDCWEYDEIRGEYYLHLFAKSQADLNYHEAAVLEEIKGILRFWLDKGVSGFRCDVVNILFKDSLESSRKKLLLTGSEHYLSLEGTHEILRTLRKEVLSEYDCFTVGETVFVTPRQGRELCEEDRGELDMIFSFEHMETDQFFVKWFPRRFNARRFVSSLCRWQKALSWNALYFENHDQPRSVSRFGCDWNDALHAASAKMLCTLLLTLRGTPFIYQGQEIGMTNFDYTDMRELDDVESKNIDALLKRLGFSKAARWRKMQKRSRDNARTPMQWSAEKNAGFTSGTPWLGVNKNYTRINVEAQMADANSIWRYYQKLLALRASSDVLLNGGFKPLALTRRLFAFERHYAGDTLRVLCNFSSRPLQADFAGELLLSSEGRSEFHALLLPYETVILKKGELMP